jgi:hypothetical protein
MAAIIKRHYPRPGVLSTGYAIFVQSTFTVSRWSIDYSSKAVSVIARLACAKASATFVLRLYESLCMAFTQRRGKAKQSDRHQRDSDKDFNNRESD